MTLMTEDKDNRGEYNELLADLRSGFRQLRRLMVGASIGVGVTIIAAIATSTIYIAGRLP